jgi:hypothetical protein
MKMRALAILTISAVACSTRPSDPVTALDHVAQCAPGRPYRPCSHAIEVARMKTVFPANDLIEIRLLIASLAEEGAPLLQHFHISFRHSMNFRDGYGTVRARVMDLMQKELGPPTNTGVAPINDPGLFVGDYWLVEDGIWILSEQTVLWYSKSFSRDLTMFERTDPAPRSAPLWNKVGRLLVTY